MKGKSVQVCIWLNSLLRGVMKVVERHLYLEKSPLKNINRSKVKRGFKKIQGREKSFPSYGRVRIVSSKRRFVELMISCVGTEHVPVRKSHPLSVT